MTRPGNIRNRVATAGSLPELLDAACDAFEAMLAVIRQNDQPDAGFFVPMVMAGASAGNGRDCVLFAPSLPPRRRRPDQPGVNGQASVTGQAAADWLAGLCGMLAGRLGEAAVSADESGDREACLGAARCAREICELMGGGRA